MFILAPFMSFVLFWRKFSALCGSARLAFIYCAVLLGILITVFTELLSCFQALSFIPLATAWSLVLVSVIYWTVRTKSTFKEFKWSWMTWPLTDKVFLMAILMIALVKGMSALLSAPNTADAMTYHLSRVEHWIQNGTVANYPTHILRQLYTAPWAEYAILQLRILSGSDQFSNMVQWFSAVGSWVAVSGIAKMLGADRRGQLFSALLAASLPMSLVQATSTQNDYVAAFWLTAFVYLLGKVFYEKQKRNAFVCAGSLGLALLTKGTAYFYAPVWLLLYLAASFKDAQRLKMLFIILAGAFMISLPFGLRNTATFGSPYWTHIPLTNQTFSPQELKDSFLKSAGFHLAHPAQQSTGEDDTANTLYVFIFLFTAAFLLFFQSPHRRKYWVYLAAIAGMFFALIIIAKDLSWNSRFQLSIFVLSCAWTGTFLRTLLARWCWMGALILVCSWPWLLRCNEHPLIGDHNIFKVPRAQQYYSERPLMVIPHLVASRIIQTNECRDIGFIGGENHWEYPWWVMLRNMYGSNFRFESVDVKNRSVSVSYPKGPFSPCMIVTVNEQRELIILKSGIYSKAWSLQLPDERTSLFVKVH